MTVKLLLSPDLNPEEIAEILVRDCGLIKSRLISQKLRFLLDQEVRKILKTRERVQEEKWADVSPEGSY